VNDGIWVVYDGECPVCRHAAYALRIKQQFGEFHLLDARTNTGHPLLQIINDRKLDLDDGMVIFCDGRVFHGATALGFLAAYGEDKGLFNRINRFLFRSDRVAALMYPWLRALRNALLKMRNKRPIDNLQLHAEPIFKSVFGEQWDDLPVVMKKHYANHPYSTDKVIVEGMLDVQYRGPLRLLQPVFRLLGTVPIVNEHNVAITVHFDSSPDSKTFGFNRQFHFREHRPYRFRTRMLQIDGNEMIEIMRFGLCWRFQYRWENDAVVLGHRGYALKLLGHLIPLPLHWITGRGDAIERAIDDDHFDMEVTLVHPWFGEIYRYAGRFKVTKEA
jgi:predicted DCC family thiol-disulfide oxidoreductase YuxK